MIKRVEKHIEIALAKSFREYKGTTFSSNSTTIITHFIKEEFLKHLNKRINLEKAYKASKSKETELIGNIEQALLLNTITGAEKALEEIKKLLTEHRESGGK
jgi:uroporphyrinogen-III decarboxylase